MDLEPSEHLIFEGHPSWRSILGFYIKGIVVIAIAGGLAAAATQIAGGEIDSGLVTAIALVGLVLVLIVGWIKRLFTTYTISNHRLHIRRGIIARAEQQTAITRVQNVNTHQSVIQRVLQIGNVNFDTAAGDDFDFEFAGVADPGEVVEAVHRAQREADAGAPAVR
ncbi:MAG: PH domain-containing protein [Solirubrobacterales bacterium]|nr:PH domain-containing protein [Solirubrobacterales bacterium]